MNTRVRIVAILLTFICSTSSWSYDHLTCSQNGTNVIFTNGVWTSKNNANIDLHLIENLNLDSSIDANGDVEYILGYNTNQGYLTDVFESIEQVIAQDLGVTQAIADQDYWPIIDGNLSIPVQLAASILKIIASTNGQTSVDINTIANQYIGYQKFPNDGAGAKVLAISHSQGGLFVNQAYQVALDQGLDPALYSAVEIATPASSVVPQGNYVNYAGDAVLYGLDNLFPGVPNFPGVPGALSANVPEVDVSFGSLFSFSAWLGHYLDDVYLAGNSNFTPVREAVISSIKNAALLLGPNCLGCTDLIVGKSQKGDYHQNPDDSEGGFVARTAVVDPSSYVDPNSEVCDQATVVEYSTVHGTSIIKDHGIVAKYAMVYDSTIGGNSAVYNEAQVYRVNLNGPISFQGDSTNPTNWITYMGPGSLGVSPEIHGPANFYLSNVTDSVYVAGDPNSNGVSVITSAMTPTYSGTSMTLTGNSELIRSVAVGDFHLSGNAYVFHSNFTGPGVSFSASSSAGIFDVDLYSAQASVPSGYVTSSYYAYLGPYTLSNVSNQTCAPWVDNNGSHCGPGPIASGGAYVQNMSILPTSGPVTIPPITSLQWTE